MRAWQLAAPGPADGRGPLVEAVRPPLEPGLGEVLLQVGVCAVCRTDLQLAEGDLDAHRLPIVPGHQAVGRIGAVGAGVDGWAVGDRAGATWLAGADGTCRYCRAGQENLCPQATFHGWDRDGGYAEAMLIRADVAVPIPEAFDDLHAAPLLCGGVIGYRALRLAGVEGGRRLGLYGFGASARLAIQVALAWGCEVAVVSRSPVDLERAEAMGAAWVGRSGERPPWPLDAAVTFAPVGSVVLDALGALAPGGTVVVNAIHLDGIPAFDYGLLWEERVLRSVANVTRRDAREFLALAASRGFVTEPEPLPLAEANEALRRLRAGEVAGAAVLVI
ncbi:MAG TPA: zinc-dependent alcohol dehydrogenase family protein [Candidatus Limnocylindrales bacterium]|nr:zinc-dependent alcohol dehydrogenase family protein [Candidatus Limnocylindrales bacterium]